MALSPGLFARARLPLSPVLPPITGPVGNGMDNDPADVEAVKRGLNALGYYNVPDYGFTGYIDQATTDAVKRFQQDNGLKQDGWLGKDGETYTAINDRLGQLPQGVDPKAEGAQSAESNTPAKASTLATPASSSSGFKRQNLLEGQPPSKADGWITKVLFQEGDLSPGPVAPPTNRPSAPAPVGPTPNPGAPAPSINEPVVPETGLGSVIGRLFGLNAIKDSLKGEPTDDGNLGHPARADAQKIHRKLDRKYGSADQIEEAGRVREAQQATEAAANAEALVKADSVKGAPNQSISIADAFRLDGPFRKPGDNADQSEPEIEYGLIILPDEAREAFEEGLADGIRRRQLPREYPRWGRRGGPLTKRTNDIVIEECLDEFGGRALLRGRVTHIGGGTEGGKGQTPVQELYINVKGAKSTKGAAYPDASFAIMAEKVRLFEGHVNSVSVRKTDGEMTADELRRFRNLGRLVGEDKAFSIPKLTESENDELQTRRLARAVCKEVANSLETQIKDFQRRQAEQQANQGEAEGRK